MKHFSCAVFYEYHISIADTYKGFPVRSLEGTHLTIEKINDLFKIDRYFIFDF